MKQICQLNCYNTRSCIISQEDYLNSYWILSLSVVMLLHFPKVSLLLKGFPFCCLPALCTNIFYNFNVFRTLNNSNIDWELLCSIHFSWKVFIRRLHIIHYDMDNPALTYGASLYLPNLECLGLEAHFMVRNTLTMGWIIIITGICYLYIEL